MAQPAEVVTCGPTVQEARAMRGPQRLASGCLAVLCTFAIVACGEEAGERAANPDLRGVTTLRFATPPAGNPASRAYAPWPSFGHDAAHSGSAPVTGPSSGRLRWRRKLEDRVVPGPVIDRGGVAYAASNGGVLHAIDVKSGRDRWTFDGGGSYGDDLSTSPLITRAGLIVWPGPNDTVFALDRAGRRQWTSRVDGQPLSPALAPDGTIVVGDRSGSLRALRPPSATGQPRTLWRLDLGSTSYASPAIAPDATVYTTVDSDLVAVRDGRQLWRVPSGQLSEVSPAVAPDGTIVLSSNDGVVYGVSPEGRVLWRHRLKILTYSVALGDARRPGLHRRPCRLCHRA